jgi:arabinofuranosyltransferase
MIDTTRRRTAPAARAVVRRPTRDTVLLVAMLVAATLLGWSRRWNGDDAFIVFRVVEHVLDGHGAVYNIGERVEAVTSPVWLALLVVAGAITPAPIEWLAVAIGLGFAVVGLGLAMVGARRLEQARAGHLVPAGALVWIGLPPAWDFATSGLETGLGTAWLGACCAALAWLADADRPGTVGTRVTRSRLVGVAVLVGLGPLLRPDFAVFTAVSGVALLALCRHRGRRTLLALVASAAALPVVVEVLRMGYYAALVPTTAIAKEATQANWAQGWLYVADLARTYATVVPVVTLIALVAVAAARDDWRHRIARLALPLGGALHAVAVVRGGGDFMHARMLLPALFALLAPVAVLRVRSRVQAGVVGIVVCWALVAAVALRPPVGTAGVRDGISDQRSFYVQATGARQPVTLDDFSGYARVARGRRAARLAAAGQRALIVDERVHPLRDDATATVVYEAGAIGLPGMAAGPEVYVLDRLGLADAYTARLRLEERRRPGHDKPLPLSWVWGRYGAAGTVPPDVRDDATAAAAAMTCPPLHALDAAITQPLTARRFVGNIAAAAALTRLRFPSDPTAAATELCAGGG